MILTPLQESECCARLARAPSLQEEEDDEADDLSDALLRSLGRTTSAAVAAAAGAPSRPRLETECAGVRSTSLFSRRWCQK